MGRMKKMAILLGIIIVLCACGGKAGKAAAIDVDLSEASNVIAYSTVYDMLMSPEDHVGKMVKLKGAYHASYSEETGAYYHNVLISDVSACCEMAMRFTWEEGERGYPEDYPEDMALVEVTGVFQTHEQAGFQQGYLAAKEMAY